jgi:transcriptional antiterminator Rof (Rho-off)
MYISYDLLVCMFDQIHILFCLWHCILDLRIVNKIQIQNTNTNTNTNSKKDFFSY